MANSILIYALINMLSVTANLPPDGWSIFLLGTMESVPPYTLVPRFILSLRKLYVRDLPGRRGNEIDTAFGSTPAFGRGAVASTMVFADAEQNEGLEHGEEMEMEEWESHGAGSSGL